MSDLPANLPTEQLPPATTVPTSETPSDTKTNEVTSLVADPAPAPGGPPGEAEGVAFTDWTEESFKGILPDGVEFTLDGMKLINELKLGEAPTKALIAYQTKLMQDAATATATEWVKQNETWKTETKALAKIGGENLPRTLAKVNEAVKKYGGEEAFKAFQITGGGNHPAIVSLIHKMASAIPSEPSAPGATQPFQSERSLADRLFPTHGVNK